MPRNTDPGFVKADSRNLPDVSFEMVADFLESGICPPELKNVKTARSARASYGDEAIGFIQLKTEGETTHVKASITPETRVRSSKYHVNCIINFKQKEILEAFCQDCVASQGRCKHATAFLFFLYRQSLQPPSTSITNWWVAPTLSKVGSEGHKIIAAADIKQAKPSTVTAEQKKIFFEATRAAISKSTEDMTLRWQLSEHKSLSMNSLTAQFLKISDTKDKETFLDFCHDQMMDAECKNIAITTASQHASPLWYDMRYARVTASKIYDASRCSTFDGSLVSSILGAVKLRDTPAMKRGRDLEPAVLNQVELILGSKIKKIGLVLRKEYAIFGASPDGIVGEHVIEVKCPSSDKTYNTYFNNDATEPSKKYAAQMMLQMVMCHKVKGFFCVANVNFEESKSVKIIEVKLDLNFITEVIENAQKFWFQAIFPIILSQ